MDGWPVKNATFKSGPSFPPSSAHLESVLASHKNALVSPGPVKVSPHGQFWDDQLSRSDLTWDLNTGTQKWTKSIQSIFSRYFFQKYQSNRMQRYMSY